MIDPPYNTGATDWKYNNNYVGKDDAYRHSKWLTFMEGRLTLAKKLLNPQDSVLMVTIDEKEYLRLGMLLEQIFSQARIQMVSTMINPANVARAGEFGRSGEYIYYVMIGDASPQRVLLHREWVSNRGRTHTGNIRWDLLKRSGTNAERKHSPGGFYPIYINPKTGKIDAVGEPLPPDTSVAPTKDGLVALLPIRKNGSEGNWQWSGSTLQQRMAQGRVKTGGNSKTGYTVYILKDGEYSKFTSGEFTGCGRGINHEIIVEDNDATYVQAIPGDIWKISSHDATQYGSRLIGNLFADRRFTFPKSLYAVKDCLCFATANKPDALILDFFAGSGTTGHATALLNAEDGGHRHCIMVTNNEVSADEGKLFTQKRLRQGDPEWEAHGIAHYVTWPRTVCAIKGQDISGAKLDGDYGCETAQYEPFEGMVADPDTEKKIRRKLFQKVKRPLYPQLGQIKKADGFAENAVFYDLVYLEPAVVQADMAFPEIAPLLWLKAGGKGRVIQRCEKYDITENYAVLFDYRYIGPFHREVQKRPEVRTLFIITDHDARYRDLCAAFPERSVIQLYEAYLRSFEISCEV